MAFHLPAGAPLAELRTAREGLRKRLREALRLSIAAATPTVEPLRRDWQSEGPAEGLWFDPSVPLTINDSGTSGTTMTSKGPYRFVRILPRSWLAPTEYGANGIRPVILGPTQGYSWGTVKGGYLTYTGSVRFDRPQPLTNFVMQFRETSKGYFGASMHSLRTGRPATGSSPTRRSIIFSRSSVTISKCSRHRAPKGPLKSLWE